MTINETLQFLTEKFGSIQNEAWFISLKKDAFSKNITAADWNALVYKAAVNSNDTEVLKYTLTNSIEWWKESEAALKSRTTDLEDRATKLEGRTTTLEGRATDLESRATVLEGRADGLQKHANNLDSDIIDGDLAKKLVIPDITEGNNDYPDGIKTLDALVKAITNGTLSQFLTVMLYGEEDTAKTLDKFLIDITKLSDNLTDLADNLAEFETDVQLDFDDVRAEFRNASLYRPQGTVSELPEKGMLEGYVYSVEPADGGSFTYDGKEYPFGTNMVYYLDEKGNGKWDSLGGIVDYRDITQWDLIVTSPLNLDTVLQSASGNVLVKLDEPYKYTLEVSLDTNLKLLDFGGSVFKCVKLTAQSVGAVVRNINRVDSDTSVFKKFDLVADVKCLSQTEDCNEVRDVTLVGASNCAYVHDCIVAPRADGGLLYNCRHVSNLDVTPLETPGYTWTVEFTECHHVSGIHCNPNTSHPSGSELPALIHYNLCTFVDPYTCAGYVQSVNSGKVPVPDSSGGVEFKEFVPQYVNNTNKSVVYAQKSEKDGGGVIMISLSPSSTNKGYIPARTDDGQIKAPNQATYPPELDQYISRRYFEENAPSGGGSKLYRHDFIVYYVKYTDYSDLNLRFSLYTSESEPYTNFNDVLSLVPFLFAASGTYDPTGEAWYKAIVTHFTHDQGKLRVFSHGWDGEGLAQFEVSFYIPNDSFVDGDNYMYDFADTVTEVF